MIADKKPLDLEYGLPLVRYHFHLFISRFCKYVIDRNESFQTFPILNSGISPIWWDATHGGCLRNPAPVETSALSRYRLSTIEGDAGFLYFSQPSTVFSPRISDGFSCAQSPAAAHLALRAAEVLQVETFVASATLVQAPGKKWCFSWEFSVETS